MQDTKGHRSGFVEPHPEALITEFTRMIARSTRSATDGTARRTPDTPCGCGGSEGTNESRTRWKRALACVFPPRSTSPSRTEMRSRRRGKRSLLHRCRTCRVHSSCRIGLYQVKAPACAGASRRAAPGRRPRLASITRQWSTRDGRNQARRIHRTRVESTSSQWQEISPAPHPPTGLRGHCPSGR